METTIDSAGRLVIPRRVREAVGLARGGRVKIELDGAGIRIEPLAGDRIREADGLLIIPASGTPMDSAAVEGLIDGDRQRR